MQINNILRFLSLCPIQISHQFRPKPRYWKSSQHIPIVPQTLGEKIKKHRLELGLFQRDAAAKIGVSSATLSNWERGVISPERRMQKRIWEFLNYAPVLPPPFPRKQFRFCKTCGISEKSAERCLFEGVCKHLN
jgi:DNA-binding transcriptional regulator YiaG